jgi:hypothetical protein
MWEEHISQSVSSYRNGRCIKYITFGLSVHPTPSLSPDNREYAVVPTILFESPKGSSDEKCLGPTNPLIRPCQSGNLLSSCCCQYLSVCSQCWWRMYCTYEQNVCMLLQWKWLAVVTNTFVLGPVQNQVGWYAYELFTLYRFNHSSFLYTEWSILNETLITRVFVSFGRIHVTRQTSCF